VQRGGCGAQIHAAPDDMTVILRDASGNVWKGNADYSWTQISGGTHGPNMSYASAARASDMCSIGSGLVYSYGPTSTYRVVPVKVTIARPQKKKPRAGRWATNLNDS
jgi:hypothetical protein